MTSPWIRCACSRMRASLRIAWTTWIDSISSEGDTMTTRARCALCTTASKFSWISAKIDSDGTNMKAVSCVSPLIRYFSEIALRWYFDVAPKGLRGIFLRVACIVGVGRGTDGVPGLQRKFGVDDQRRRAVRHLDQAVGPGAVRQRRLELVGAVRQAVGDDRLHARLAEGAARLLVGEDRLQLHDLAGERLDVVLRIVDDGEPLLQLGERYHASTWSARSWSGRSGRSWRRAAGRSTG